MSHSQFHCTSRVYLDLHGLIFETSICYWQDQPGSPRGPRHGRGWPCPVERERDGGEEERGGEPLRATAAAAAAAPRPLARDKQRGPGRPGHSLVVVVVVGFEKHRASRRPAAFAGGLPPVVGGGSRDPATGPVEERLGQTGRLGLASCGPARLEDQRVPWRRTRRPEEPSARTPALGRPAGALRWRVTCANRSVTIHSVETDKVPENRG